VTVELEVLIDKYVADRRAAGRLSRRTVANYKGTLTAFARSRLTAKEFTATQTKQELSHLRVFFRWAVEEGHLPTNPCDGLGGLPPAVGGDVWRYGRRPMGAWAWECHLCPARGDDLFWREDARILLMRHRAAHHALNPSVSPSGGEQTSRPVAALNAGPQNRPK
jgi:hypothetical protein